jgi:hydroxymethylpyrimidine pyrophosphatase-like HAD family hydrolase
MRYLALCCDYDGTLATHGQVTPATVSALTRLKASGRRVLLVTGRELDDLRSVAPPLTLFDLVVAENGALLHDPATGGETLLARPPPAFLAAALRSRGVEPVSAGRVILATWEPHSVAVREVLKAEGLDHQVILNKGAVMVLPAGVDKGTGLAHALAALQLSAHNAVGIGDAENDEALLAACECGVAVANAMPALKSRADIVTAADHGAGVAELCEQLLADDLASHEPRLSRHWLRIGHDARGDELSIAPYGERLLVLGEPQATGALVTDLRAQLVEKGYSSVMLTPGGDGGEPSLDEILARVQAGEDVDAGLPPSQTAPFLPLLLAQLRQSAARCGRPHWTFLTQTDALSPSAQLAGPLPHTAVCTAQQLDGFTRQALGEATLLIAIGEPRALVDLCRAAQLPAPDPGTPDTGALAWRANGPRHTPVAIRVAGKRRGRRKLRI